LKIYHFCGERPERGRFFGESLADYLEKSGLELPETVSGESIKIKNGPHGKPYFGDPALEGIFFSRSHSKDHEVVCFSDSEIGVDCEDTDARPGIGKRYKSIAGRCFTDDELEYVMKDDGDPITRFFEVWTAKEAYMKYTGNGFSEGFQTFSVFKMPGVAIETGRLNDAPNVIYSVCVAKSFDRHCEELKATKQSNSNAVKPVRG